MLKRLAVGLVVIIIVLGIIFIILDILDIQEDYRLSLPMDILNLILIFIIAIAVAYMSIVVFRITSLPEVIYLGIAALVFGISSLFRGWVDVSGNLVLNIESITVLGASFLHFLGVNVAMARNHILNTTQKQTLFLVITLYFVLFTVVILVVVFAFRGVTMPYTVPGEGATMFRGIFRIIAIIFTISSAIITYKLYKKLHTSFYYWYSLGLILFAVGICFIPLGGIETRISWVGRFSVYLCGIYFLLSIRSINRDVKI